MNWSCDRQTKLERNWNEIGVSRSCRPAAPRKHEITSRLVYFRSSGGALFQSSENNGVSGEIGGKSVSWEIGGEIGGGNRCQFIFRRPGAAKNELTPISPEKRSPTIPGRHHDKPSHARQLGGL